MGKAGDAVKPRRLCRQCGRTIRGRGIDLYRVPAGMAQVCSRRCMRAWEGEASEACSCRAHRDARRATAGTARGR